jgi:gamma-glutamylcyclotransferase (GGCT)/AIG2-like uncharacterized protein YtfP/GNAT superfamily N-acetyltransferase
VEVRPRLDSDIGACVELAGRVQSTDGYPPHLDGELRDFVISSDAIAAWVAVCDGTVAGHVALHARSAGPVMRLVTERLGLAAADVAVVTRLFVSPQCRRSGIGRTLLRSATAAALDRKLVPILDAGTPLAGAIALYEQAGWRRVGDVTFHFGDRVLPAHVYVFGGALRVFVYGTLMPGESRWPLLEPFAASHQRAETWGEVWDTGRGYPAARFGDGGRIPGFVVELQPRRLGEAMAALDEIEGEGHLYRRVTIETSAGPAQAYEWIMTAAGSAAPADPPQ